MKIKVGIFFGGKSVEHEVSIISALQAASAMNKDKFEAVPVYITKENIMYTGSELLEIQNYSDINALIQKCVQIALVNDSGVVKLVKYPVSLFAKSKGVVNNIDVALPVVHGANVEDGTIQGLFEIFNLPYAGCDVLSSALCMDKYASKAILKSAGLPVLDCMTVDFGMFTKGRDETVDKIEKTIGFPLIIKPINLGSSVGISIASDRNAIFTSMDYAFEYSDKVLIERAVTNLREINCSVLGDKDEAYASFLEEPANSGDILSYADKYLNGGKSEKSGMASLKRVIPAPVSDDTTAKIKSLAVDAFKVLGCSGVVRIDFLLDGTDIYINEINTIPGSLSFYLWEPAGKKYSVLLDDLIALALKKKREKAKISHSFETNILSGFISGQGGNSKNGNKAAF